MAKRSLTDKQQAFLDVLFEQAKGNFVEAKRLAGYSENVSTQSIVDSLEEEIYTLTKKYISQVGVKAAVAMNHVIENPTDLGNKEKMQAAKDILDRAGYKPKDKVEVETSEPLFILPAKKEEDAEGNE
jgi:hypothetical protein